VLNTKIARSALASIVTLSASLARAAPDPQPSAEGDFERWAASLWPPSAARPIEPSELERLTGAVV
jgi:hypothetical protein